MIHFTASAIKAGIISGDRRAIAQARRLGLSGSVSQIVKKLDVILSST